MISVDTDCNVKCDSVLDVLQPTYCRRMEHFQSLASKLFKCTASLRVRILVVNIYVKPGLMTCCYSGQAGRWSRSLEGCIVLVKNCPRLFARRGWNQHMNFWSINCSIAAYQLPFLKATIVGAFKTNLCRSKNLLWKVGFVSNTSLHNLQKVTDVHLCTFSVLYCWTCIFVYGIWSTVRLHYWKMQAFQVGIF